MKLLKLSVRLSLLCLVLSIHASAQPGETCVLDYNPFEIKELGYVYANLGLRAVYSSAAFEEKINSRHIFIGRVVSQEPDKSFKLHGFGEDYFKSLKINVVKEITGKLAGKKLDISYKASCWRIIGMPETGSDYIFFAEAIDNAAFSGLVASKWSAALNGIPKNEIDKIIRQIHDYRNGIEQPQIVGYLIKHKPNPYSDYLNQSFGGANLWRTQNFKNDWRIKKWEYDPRYAEPLKKIKVVVKNLKDVEIASADTDSSGRFEFANLPKGTYVIVPDVPPNYFIVGKCRLYLVQKGGAGFNFTNDENVCDRTIRIDVAPSGSIETDIKLEQGSWKDTTVPDIFLVGANSKTNEIYQDYLFPIALEKFWDFDKKLSFSVDQVMAGEFVLKISTSLGSTIYYPGVRDIKKARIIEIKEGKTTKINFSITSLKN